MLIAACYSAGTKREMRRYVCGHLHSGSGLLIGLPAWLSIALWFLLLGRNLGKHDHRRDDQAVENISLVVTLRRRPSGRVVL
jgi:hypothetical protein